MVEGTVHADAIAAILADGDRMLSVTGDLDRSVALGTLLEKLSTILVLPDVLLFDDMFRRIAGLIEADPVLRRASTEWSEERLRVLIGAVEEGGSAVDLGIAAFPLFFLNHVGTDQDQLLEPTLGWIGRCIVEEYAFFDLPVLLRASFDIGEVGLKLRDDLVSVIGVASDEAFGWRISAHVRTLIEQRSSLKLLFSEVPRDPAIANCAVKRKAFLATTSVYKLEASDIALTSSYEKDVLVPLLRAWNNFPWHDDDIYNEVKLREKIAETCLEQLKNVQDDRDVHDLRDLVALSAPRNYSYDGDYLRLQQARASIYDKLVRMEHVKVDRKNIPGRAGRVALIVSTLVDSAETMAILAHYEGLRIAGLQPIVVIWPHYQHAKMDFNERVSHVDTLDLSDLTLGDRVEVVRQCLFQCILFMNNLTWGWSDYIAASTFRLAPIQIATYLSVITVGFRNIDYFLVGEESEGSGLEDRYIEKPCEMPGSVLCFPPVDSGVARSHNSSDRPTLVCGASFSKLTPRLIREHAQIAEHLDATKLIFYPLNPAWGNTLPAHTALAYLQRLSRKGSGLPTDRIELAGPWEDQSGIFSLLHRADLYLDAYPHTGGLSVLEPVRAGVPVAYRSGLTQRSLQARNVMTATGAMGVDLGQGMPSREQFQTISDTRSTTRAIDGLNDVADFGRRLLAGLQRVGVERSTDPDWLHDLHVEKFLTLKIGSRIKLVPDELSGSTPPRHVLSWTNINQAGRRKSVSSTSFFHHGKGAVLLKLAGFQEVGETGPQIGLRANDVHVGWTEPFPPLSCGGQAQTVVIPARDGWNVLEFEADGLEASVEPNFFIADPCPVGGAVAAQGLGVRWEAVEGFSYWEGAHPPEKLDRSFRWCVGLTARILAFLDLPADRLHIRMRTPATRLEMEIRCNGRLVVHQDEFPGRLSEDVVLDLEGPFKGGEIDIQFDVSPPQLAADRPISFILLSLYR